MLLTLWKEVLYAEIEWREREIKVIWLYYNIILFISGCPSMINDVCVCYLANCWTDQRSSASVCILKYILLYIFQLFSASAEQTTDLPATLYS